MVNIVKRNLHHNPLDTAVAAPQKNTTESVMNVSCVYLRDAIVYSERLNHLWESSTVFKPLRLHSHPHAALKPALSNNFITMSLNKHEHSLIQTNKYQQWNVTICLHSNHGILYLCSMYNVAPLISYSTCTIMKNIYNWHYHALLISLFLILIKKERERMCLDELH